LAERYNFFGSTDIGQVKTLNEDAFEGLIYNDVLFLIAADGLGSKEGAVFASRIAVNEMIRHIKKHFVSDNTQDLKNLIGTGMYWINRLLLSYKKANDTLYSGFGTTFTVSAINKNKDIVVGHAGNTRFYILRNGSLIQMTKDHTEAQLLYEKKEIRKEEIIGHPEAGVLTKALGNWEEVEFDVFGGKVSKEDILYLCTDGVFRLLNDEEMQAIILEAGESEKACDWLVKGADKRGGVDNMTVMLSYINF
jgi:protein phosphatase